MATWRDRGFKAGVVYHYDTFLPDELACIKSKFPGFSKNDSIVFHDDFDVDTFIAQVNLRKGDLLHATCAASNTIE